MNRPRIHQLGGGDERIQVTELVAEAEVGPGATLLQFSDEFCPPCSTSHALLDALAAELPASGGTDPPASRFSAGITAVLLPDTVGVALHLMGAPFGLMIFAAAAFTAAVPDTVFDRCVGCQISLLDVRVGLVGRKVDTRA